MTFSALLTVGQGYESRSSHPGQSPGLTAAWRPFELLPGAAATAVALLQLALLVPARHQPNIKD
jgi:hypothetical protein